MTSVRQTHVSTMSSSNHDNNLDALLEELQTSVSRPGSSLGHSLNGPVTGYREVTRTVTTETAGQPVEKTTDYHIEYLNPSNTTTVLQETYRDPPLSIMHDAQSGRNAGSYKTVQYQYNTSTSGSSLQDPSLPVADARMRQNITELDSLLDDLHTAQKTGFADSSVSRHPAGIDPGLLEPIDSSTPKSGHVSRLVEKRTVQEQRYGSVGQGRSSPAREIRKELVFTGGNKRDQPSPVPVAHKEVYRYESKTTRSGSANSRDLSPPQDRRQPSPSPARQLASVRNYNYSSSDEVPRTPTLHRSPSPSGVRSSSNTTVRQYNYSNRDFSPEGGRQPPLRSPSPSTKVTTVRNYTYNTPQEPPRNTSSKVTSVNSYSYNSSSRDTRSTQEVPRSPPPHRSPSPVSFTPPPLPTHKSSTVKTYSFEQPGSSPPYVRPQSPQPVQKFSPSDPSRTLTYQVSPPPQPPQPTVITYKYSSQTTHSTKYPGEENVPLLPRPFPTPSPTPEQQQQQPPKKLDELMASFSDTDIQHHQETSSRYIPVREPPVHRTEATAPAPVAPPAPQAPTGPSPASTAAAMQVKSKNIAGPPVYYPPGVELFAKKEESMVQSQSGGGKYKAKAKYEYESSSKMKSKESSGKTVVPVCLPVCCAMPCVIM